MDPSASSSIDRRRPFRRPAPELDKMIAARTHITPTKVSLPDSRLGFGASSLFDTFCGARVIFMFNSLELGGAEGQAIQLAAFFKEVLQSNVQVWGFSAPGRAADLCDQLGIRHR